MDDFNLRPATAGDVMPVAALHRDRRLVALRRQLHPTGEPPLGHWIDVWRRRVDDPSWQCLVAVRDDRLVAAAASRPYFGTLEELLIVSAADPAAAAMLDQVVASLGHPGRAVEMAVGDDEDVVGLLVASGWAPQEPVRVRPAAGRSRAEDGRVQLTRWTLPAGTSVRRDVADVSSPVWRRG